MGFYNSIGGLSKQTTVRPPLDSHRYAEIDHSCIILSHECKEEDTRWSFITEEPFLQLVLSFPTDDRSSGAVSIHQQINQANTQPPSSSSFPTNYFHLCAGVAFLILKPSWQGTGDEKNHKTPPLAPTLTVLSALHNTFYISIHCSSSSQPIPPF